MGRPGRASGRAGERAGWGGRPGGGRGSRWARCLRKGSPFRSALTLGCGRAREGPAPGARAAARPVATSPQSGLSEGKGERPPPPPPHFC